MFFIKRLKSCVVVDVLRYGFYLVHALLHLLNFDNILKHEVQTMGYTWSSPNRGLFFLQHPSRCNIDGGIVYDDTYNIPHPPPQLNLKDEIIIVHPSPNKMHPQI